MITIRRALALAVAALGDCDRILQSVGDPQAGEVREARDLLVAIRERAMPGGSPAQTPLLNEETHIISREIAREVAPAQQPGARDVALP